MPHFVSQGWSLSPADKAKYNSLFHQNVLPQQNFLSSQQAREIFMQSKLNPTELFLIWNLVDPGQTGRLNVEQFSAAMHLIFGRLSGRSLPSSLPSELQSLISGGSTSNMFQSNSSNIHQNNQLNTPTSGRSFDSVNSAFPVSFPGPQSQNTSSNQNPEFDFANLKTLESEVEKKRALVANIPPPFPPISDQEIHTLKNNIEKLYHNVPFHHPNFSTYIFEKSNSLGNSRSIDLASSIKSEIDKLFDESFDSILTELADKIFQCQSELFKLEDSELYGYSLPTNAPAPVIPQISSSGDAIAQKAAAMLAQRMQQLNLATPVQTIPSDAQNRIQEKDAVLKKESEDRKSRANQLISTLTKYRKDFDDLVASLTKSNSHSSDLKQRALDWQSGSQCSSYKVGRFVEELSALGKSLNFPPEVKSSLPRESTPPHSQKTSDIKTPENPREISTPVSSSKKTKDLIEQFRNAESSNDPFASLVSEKEKQNTERDLFSQIIHDKENQTVERDLFSQIIKDKESTKVQSKEPSEDPTIPDFSQSQSDPFVIKNKSEKEAEPVNPGSSSIPLPPPLPNLSATNSSGTSVSSSKFQGPDSKKSTESKNAIFSVSNTSPDDTNQSANPKQFIKEISSPMEESTPRPAFSDNNPFARLNKTPKQPIQVTEAKKSISNNNPFGKHLDKTEPSLPPGVKFSVSAIYAYKEPEASITFQPGDVLYITDDGDDPEGEWYFGYVKNQPDVEDWFPRSFVASLGEESLPRPESPEHKTQLEPVPSEPEPPSEPECVTVGNEHSTNSSSWRILYEFAPEDSENPSPIPTDTIVVLLDQTDPDWWLIEDPRPDSPPDSQVYVPANFLEAVVL